MLAAQSMEEVSTTVRHHIDNAPSADTLTQEARLLTAAADMKVHEARCVARDDVLSAEIEFMNFERALIDINGGD